MSLMKSLIDTVKVLGGQHNPINALLSELIRLIPGLLISETMHELIAAFGEIEGKMVDSVTVDPLFNPNALSLTVTKGDTTLQVTETTIQRGNLPPVPGMNVVLFRGSTIIDSFEPKDHKSHDQLGDLMVRMIAREQFAQWAVLVGRAITMYRDSTDSELHEETVWYNRNPAELKEEDIPEGYSAGFDTWGVTKPQGTNIKVSITPTPADVVPEVSNVVETITSDQLEPEVVDAIVEQVLATTDGKTIERLEGKPINEDLLAKALEVDKQAREELPAQRPIQELKMDMLQASAAQVEADMNENPSVIAGRKVGFAGLERLDQHFSGYTFDGEYTCENFAEFIAESYVNTLASAVFHDGFTEQHKQALNRFTEAAIQKLAAVNWERDIMLRNRAVEGWLNVPNWALDETRIETVYCAFDLQDEQSSEIPSQLVDELRAMLTADLRDIRKALKDINVVELIQDDLNFHYDEKFRLAIYKFTRNGERNPMLLLMMFDVNGILYVPMTFTSMGELDRFTFLEYNKQTQFSSILDVGSRMAEEIQAYRKAKVLA